MTTTQPLDKRSTPRELDGPEPAARRGASVLSRIPKIGPIKPIKPILSARFRPLNRPMLWVELALIAISYYLYTLTRLAAPAHEGAAMNRGFAILRAEHYLGLNFELTVNHAVDKVKWLVVSMNYYYATLHFIVPVGVLIWVYWKFPDRYRAIRTVLFAMTGLALIGFFFYALCPPRLLPGAGFIDTFVKHGTWGHAASDGVAGLPSSSTNEFAAMPSLHIGWSVWCALAIAHLAQRRWVKILGVLYPCATFVVIVSTANHYVLDAVGGLVTLAAAFLVQRVLQGRSVYGPLPGDDDPAEVPRQNASSPGDAAKQSAAV